jgi:hypothetical protein
MSVVDVAYAVAAVSVSVCSAHVLLAWIRGHTARKRIAMWYRQHLGNLVFGAGLLTVAVLLLSVAEALDWKENNMNPFVTNPGGEISIKRSATAESQVIAVQVWLKGDAPPKLNDAKELCFSLTGFGSVSAPPPPTVSGDFGQLTLSEAGGEGENATPLCIPVPSTSDAAPLTLWLRWSVGQDRLNSGTYLGQIVACRGSAGNDETCTPAPRENGQTPENQGRQTGTPSAPEEGAQEPKSYVVAPLRIEIEKGGPGQPLQFGTRPADEVTLSVAQGASVDQEVEVWLKAPAPQELQERTLEFSLQRGEEPPSDTVSGDSNAWTLRLDADPRTIKNIPTEGSLDPAPVRLSLQLNSEPTAQPGTYLARVVARAEGEDEDIPLKDVTIVIRAP